jgi:hypothetical protein
VNVRVVFTAQTAAVLRELLGQGISSHVLCELGSELVPRMPRIGMKVLVLRSFFDKAQL